MERDDVIRVMMSITPPDDFVDGGINEELLDELMPLFQAIAADVRAKEREACALLCEMVAEYNEDEGPELAEACAYEIRTRGDV